MTDAFRSVARGLRLTNIGFLLACWGAAAAFGLFWFIDRVYMYTYRDESRWLFVSLFFAAIAAGVAGVVVGFIGRVRCMKMPVEYSAVRGRAIAAIVVEGSGWGSLLAGAGVMTAMGFKVLPVYPWVPGIGMILSGVMILGGRILFLRFLRLLARAIGDKPSVLRARLSFALFLADWVAGLVGLGVVFFGTALDEREIALPVGYLIWIAAAASGLYGLILYDRLLSGLARSVQTCAETTAEDDEGGPAEREHPRRTTRSEPDDAQDPAD